MRSPLKPRKKDRLSRSFYIFWSGNMSSNLADGIMLTTLPMTAAILTNDPLLVAGLTVMRFLPRLLFSLFVGALVDRLNQITLMISANLIRSVILGFLALLVAFENSSIAVLYLVMFAVMTCEVFYDTSADTLILKLAPPNLLDRANSRVEGGRVVTERFAGAPTASFLFVVAAALPIAVNAGAYLLGALILLAIPFSWKKMLREARTDPHKKIQEGLIDSISSGIRYLLTDRHLLRFTMFTVVMHMAFMAQGAILVLLVQDHFGVAPQFFGLFLGTAAIGALLGALTVEKSVQILGRFRVEVIAFGTMGVCCALMAIAPNAIVAALVWALLAFVLTLSNTIIVGILQLAIPEDLLGRVLSTTRMLAMGLSPIGALVGGFLARGDLRFPSIAAAVAMVVATIWVVGSLRSICVRADQSKRDRLKMNSS